MTLQTQVKVFDSAVVSFGGTSLRRLMVSVGGKLRPLLLHEETNSTPFLLAGQPISETTQASLHLIAEWGEPLGEVYELQADAQTGKLEAYALRLRHRDGRVSEVSVSASDTFWWQGELYCRKRLSYQLRDVQRGKRPRVRPEAA